MKEKTALLKHIVLILMAALCIGPVSLVFINSFKLHNDIIKNPISLSFTAGFENYINEWRAGSFGRAYLNSAIYVSSTILIVLVCATFAAYALSKRGLKGRSGVMLYLMVSMTVPLQLFMAPLYIVYVNLNLLGNLVAVSAIIAACNLPFAIMLLRTFFISIPKELEEAAIVDGASTWQVLWRVVFPLVAPGMLTVGIIVGLNAWNDFLISSTFLIGEKNLTASLTLVTFNGAFANDIGMNMAGAVICIMPILIAFLIAQKYFIDGLVNGSVKG